LGRSLPPPKGRGSALAQAILNTHRDNPATAGCAFLGADMAKTIKPGSPNSTSAKFVKTPSRQNVQTPKEFGAAVKASRTKTARAELSNAWKSATTKWK
jgi:hypothetical protein